MKWFKHDSDASNDAKLKKLRLKYGAQGYGIYWYCLELIARNVEKHNLTFELEHDAELIADDFKLSSDLVQHIMTFMVEIGLFEDTNGIITCLKMANRADEYTQQLMRENKKLQLSLVYAESVPRISEVKEEKRKEENIQSDFDVFWSNYKNKAKKEYARDCWNKKKPPIQKVLAALEWQNQQQQWTKDKHQFVPMASTYINQKMWMDEKQSDVYDVDSYNAIMERALYGK